MIDALKHRNARVRAEAARRIGRMGPAAATAEAALKHALKDKDAAVRAAVTEALQRVQGGTSVPAGSTQ
ncbi:unnamed protein product [marine sediment metagenome]|uniref:HEAT repeat domain-containing protein n=1 Tax=marine sediment metagenome TaxID=412755 RepID=X1DX80_9ZZZZ